VTPPAKAKRYLVQVRPWSGPWRIVVRCWHLERATTWLHQLKDEGHPQVRIVHDGLVIASWRAQLDQEA